MINYSNKSINSVFSKNYIWLLIIFCSSHLFIHAQQADEDDLQEAVAKIKSVFRNIEYDYMEEVDIESLAEDAINGMLKKLDPHSVYIPKDKYKKMNEPLKGNFEGIGVKFNILRDTVIILSTVQYGPSEKAGIESGDRIVSVDGNIVAGVGISDKDIARLVKGRKNTEVNIGVKRKGVDSLLYFKVKRDKIPIYSVNSFYMAAPEIGYIRINRFSANTRAEFKNAVSQLQGKGMKDLILDLRGNSGGYLRTAINISDEFLAKSELIVYTEGRSERKRNYYARQNGCFEEGRLVVLVNEGSASASEIVSGAVQDWDRGLIIGRRTYGKGLVQKPFVLSDSSYLRLTIAQYFTPSGRSIQKSYKEGHEAYFKDIANRKANGELTNGTDSSAYIADTLQFKTKKLDRTVYGGGGIFPDVYVPLDTTYKTSYYNRLQKNKIITHFTIDYFNQHKDSLQQIFTNVQDYVEDYILGDAILYELMNYGEVEGIAANEEELIPAAERIKLSIKARMGEYLFSTSAYYQVYNQQSPSYLRAIETLSTGDLFNQYLADQKQ